MTDDAKREGLALVLAVAISAAVGLVTGWSIGKFSGPEVTAIRAVDRVVYRDRIVEKVVTVQAKAVTRTIYRDVVRAPDGTVTDRSIVTAKAVSEKHEDVARVDVREVEKVVEREKIVMERPRWRVDVGGGASLVQPALRIVGPLVIQVGASHRIAGGLSAGIWLNTVGAGGASVSLEF